MIHPPLVRVVPAQTEPAINSSAQQIVEQSRVVVDFIISNSSLVQIAIIVNGYFILNLTQQSRNPLVPP